MPDDPRTRSRDVEPWKLQWTPELIERFWNWYATHPGAEANYFSRRVGHSVLREITRNVPLAGLVVDLGSGRGYMVEQLLQRGVRTMAIDNSTKSVEELEARFGGRAGFEGARRSEGRIPMEDGTADVVLFLETIEHVDASLLTSILGDIRRVLRPGGVVVVTTPHDEDLAAEEVFCPNCACVFHRMQHLRASTVKSLESAMTASGFSTITCRATYFSHHHGLHASLERVRRRIEQIPDPHLLYIGRKDA